MDMERTCLELKAQLSDYIDGDLNEGLCKELEEHLANCDNCRVVVDTLRKTILLYRHYDSNGAMPAVAHDRLIHVLGLDGTRQSAP